MLQNAGNQRPDLLTALMNMSLVLRLPWKMHLCRSSSDVLYMTSPVPLRYPARGGLHPLACGFQILPLPKKIKLGSNIRPEKKRQAQTHASWKQRFGVIGHQALVLALVFVVLALLMTAMQRCKAHSYCSQKSQVGSVLSKMSML